MYCCYPKPSVKQATPASWSSKLSALNGTLFSVSSRPSVIRLLFTSRWPADTNEWLIRKETLFLLHPFPSIPFLSLPAFLSSLLFLPSFLSSSPHSLLVLTLFPTEPYTLNHRQSGERCNSPSGSGRSSAAKRSCVVFFELKRAYVGITVTRSAML